VQFGSDLKSPDVDRRELGALVSTHRSMPQKEAIVVAGKSRLIV
jgi:hypothetical protein